MKPDVGDVEIVCVPKAEYNLLGEAFRTDLRIEYAIFSAGYKFIKNGEKFKQFDLGPCKCDLFITTPECWGVIFTIRTGCAEFSHRLVTPRNAGGLLPSCYQVRDGRIWATGSVPLDTPEEMDVFNALTLKWIAPEDRIV
jgi:DNA polymerase/3'-5' exonuclease PolX